MSNDPTRVVEETANDTFGSYVRRWHYTPPAVDAQFRAIHESWNEDYTVRDIYEWSPA